MFDHRRWNTVPIVVAAFTFLLSSVGTAAVPLAKQVPGDAMVYVGWRGADQLGEDYDRSRLKALMADTELRRRVSETLGKLLNQAEAEQALGPDAPEVDKGKAIKLADLFWRHQWAGYVSGVTFKEDQSEPNIHAGFLIDPGDDAKVVRKRLKQAIAQYEGAAHNRPELVERNGVLGLQMGEADRSSTLAGNAESRQAWQKLEASEPVLASWVDFSRLMKTIEEGVRRDSPKDKLANWLKFKDVLGLGGLKRLAMTASFDQRDFAVNVYMHAPSPRHGLVKLFAGEKIRDKTLKLVPKRAKWLRAFHFDPGQAFDLAKQAIKALGPEPRKQFNKGMALARKRFNINIERDLLDALGDQWVTYSHPTFSGYMGMSFALAQNVEKPARLKQTLGRLKQLANNILKRQADIPFQIATLDMGELKINTVGLPGLSPGWAIADGRFYLALSPQAISTMHRKASRPGRSILQNEKFQAMRRRLGGKQASGLMFTDVKRTASTYYQNYAMWLNLAAPFVEKNTGVDLTRLVPPMDTIRPHLAPAGRVFVPTEDGFVTRSVTPFPGATLLSPDAGINLSSSTGPLAIGVLLPALAEARQAAQPTSSLSNATAITQACITYAMEHGDQYPPSLGALVRGNYLKPKILIHPTTDTEVPANFRQWNKQKQDRWIQKHAGYRLVADQEKVGMDAQRIVLHTRPQFAMDGSYAVAFADGHAERMKQPTLQRLLKDQTGQGIRGLPAGVN
jgi:hypothetical protein